MGYLLQKDRHSCENTDENLEYFTLRHIYTVFVQKVLCGSVA